jgi:hypothetical protein
MEREGYVSLWIGEFESKEKFTEYIAISYTEDGDALQSEFEKDFAIEYYDTDFREVEFYSQSPGNLKDALEGFSYDDRITANFIDLVEKNLPASFNSVLLLYNFNYIERLRKPKDGINTLHYIGTVPYKNHPS